MVSTKEVKQELSRRAEVVTQRAFLEEWVWPCLGAQVREHGAWKTKIIQLDGTGAATLQITCGGELSVFAKLYPDGNGAHIYEKLRALRGAGFGQGERYQAVEPLGYIPQFEMLLTRGADGPAVSTFIGVDDGALLAGAKEAALWLAKLHTSPLRIGRPQSLLVSGELLPLARRLGKMISSRPRFLGLALDMIRALEALAEETAEGLLVQSHGQYRPIHVFVSDPAVTVIDLDRSRPCDPARDVAEFLHRLRMTMFWHHGTVLPADAPTEAFLATYLEAVGESSYLTNLKFHWARYICHSLNRKLKDGDDDLELDAERTVAFYQSEFEKVIQGRFRI